MEKQLERITTSRNLCEELVKREVIPWAVLWHLLTDGEEQDLAEWLVGSMFIPTDGGGEYKAGECIPAWTKEELDVMLGGEVKIPQLPRKTELSRFQNPNLHTGHTLSTRLDYEKGSDCSAALLIRLIDDKSLKVAEINKRFMDVFKLVENGFVNLSTFPKILL